MARNRLRRTDLRFLLRFAAVAAVLFALYAFPYAENGISERWFRAYLAAYTRVAGGILALCDQGVRVSGTFIHGRASLHIVKTCDAMEANLLFLAAVVAFPLRNGVTSWTSWTSWNRKLVAAVAGLALLAAANVLRICSLYFIGVHAPAAFDLFHVELWPALLIVLAVAQFAAWVAWIQRGAAPGLAGSAAS